MRFVVALAVSAVLLGGCGAATPSGPERSRTAAPTDAAVASPSASATPSNGSPDPGNLTYVAFGDSWSFGAHCHGCNPFPGLYAASLKATNGRPVTFLNLTTNGGSAASLLADFKSTQTIRDAVAAADVVIISTGGNDLGPAFDATVAGNCGGADKLDCFRTVAESLRVSFEGILTEIDGLRAGRPTAVRLVTISNEFLADPDLIDALGVDFGRTRGVAVTKMNRDVECLVAAAHHAKCVDLGAALNGSDLLQPQDVNTQDAMQKVADAILASGLDELQ